MLFQLKSISSWNYLQHVKVKKTTQMERINKQQNKQTNKQTTN